jgi:hypothetical protein
MFYAKAWRISAAVSRFFSPSHCKQVEEREKRQSRPKNEMRRRSKRGERRARSKLLGHFHAHHADVVGEFVPGGKLLDFTQDGREQFRAVQ